MRSALANVEVYGTVIPGAIRDVGHIPGYEPADLRQECYLALVAKRKHFDCLMPVASQFAFARRIVVQHLINLKRSQKTAKRLPHDHRGVPMPFRGFVRDLDLASELQLEGDLAAKDMAERIHAGLDRHERSTFLTLIHDGAEAARGSDRQRIEQVRAKIARILSHFHATAEAAVVADDVLEDPMAKTKKTDVQQAAALPGCHPESAANGATHEGFDPREPQCSMQCYAKPSCMPASIRLGKYKGDVRDDAEVAALQEGCLTQAEFQKRTLQRINLTQAGAKIPPDMMPEAIRERLSAETAEAEEEVADEDTEEEIEEEGIEEDTDSDTDAEDDVEEAEDEDDGDGADDEDSEDDEEEEEAGEDSDEEAETDEDDSDDDEADEEAAVEATTEPSAETQEDGEMTANKKKTKAPAKKTNGKAAKPAKAPAKEKTPKAPKAQPRGKQMQPDLERCNGATRTIPAARDLTPEQMQMALERVKIGTPFDLAVGMELVRKNRDGSETVIKLAKNGFVYEGVAYPSLTAAAMNVVKRSINGNTMFSVVASHCTLVRGKGVPGGSYSGGGTGKTAAAKPAKAPQKPAKAKPATKAPAKAKAAPEAAAKPAKAAPKKAAKGKSVPPPPPSKKPSKKGK